MTMSEDIERGRVRIWDKDWNCLVDERAREGDTPSDVVNRAIEAVSGVCYARKSHPCGRTVFSNEVSTTVPPIESTPR